QSAKVAGAILSLAEDSNPRVRFQVALSLGVSTNGATSDALTRIARRDFADRWAALAVMSSIGPNAWPFLKKLVGNTPEWLNTPTSEQSRFLDQTARLIGASHSEAELKECLMLLTQAPTTSSGSGHFAI